MKNIAIIPARGGSKRIHRKNIKNFCGKPIIYWTIQAIKKSNIFDEIVVSTDDEEIAEIATKYGASTPFFRPKDLADDFTTTHSVVFHAVNALIDLGYELDNICCLYPCSPFIQPFDLVETLKLIEGKKNYYIYPVTEFPHPINRAIRLTKENKVQLIDSDTEQTRTQDLEPAYHDSGQFYWGTKDTWLNVGKMHSNSYGYNIPNWRVVDIDTMEDWYRAEIIFKSLDLYI